MDITMDTMVIDVYTGDISIVVMGFFFSNRSLHGTGGTILSRSASICAISWASLWSEVQQAIGADILRLVVWNIWLTLW